MTMMNKNIIIILSNGMFAIEYAINNACNLHYDRCW